VPECLAFKHLHGDEGPSVRFVDFVDRADIGVVQGGRSLGLPLKTAEGLWVVGKFVGKELQGDVAAELQVFGLVNHTHAAATDLAKDAVMGNGLPHRLGGSGHCRKW